MKRDSTLSNDFEKKNDYEQMMNSRIKIGLLEASRQPTKPSDMKSFKNLHSPRVHKMAEWLLQYESVCRRQEQYLQEIKELRQQFQSRQSDRINAPTFDNKTGFHWRPSRSPLTKSNVKWANSVCVLHPQRKHSIDNTNRNVWQTSDTKVEFTESRVVSKSVDADTYSKRHQRQPDKLPQIVGWERNKTDYEPIENIAKRNKLNFSKYFGERQTSERRTPRERTNAYDVYVQSPQIE